MGARRFQLPKDGARREPDSARQATPENDDDVEGHRRQEPDSARREPDSARREPDSARRATPEDERDVEGHIIRRSPSSGGEAIPDDEPMPGDEGLRPR